MSSVAIPEHFVGLMSGTSMDGVDAVVVAIGNNGLQVVGHASQNFPEGLRSELLALNQRHGSDELHRASVAGVQLARIYAAVVHSALAVATLDATQIRAIGAHGQTVRHQPRLAIDGVSGGYTLQLNQPALLAETTGIAVVADFRARDVAAGGQGAPLVPLFHQAMFARPGVPVGVLNVGGIANLTVLPPAENGFAGVIGFDCGPGNLLMDAWCHRHLGFAFDRDGAWAASGSVVPELLQSWRADPYFQRHPPKSTGRDDFHVAWLEAGLRAMARPLAPQDVQASLCELTAVICAEAVARHAPEIRQLGVCGGGAANRQLMARVSALLPGVHVAPTDDWGLAAQQVEAAAFAWLASLHTRQHALALGPITGAKGARILGAYYPG